MIIELTSRTLFEVFYEIRFFLAVRSTLRYTLDTPMDRSEVEKISKALADATRLKIFEAISVSRHMNCGEIVSMRGVTPATVSHHLKILSEARLIACRREGQFVYSRSVPETIEAYTRKLGKIARGRKAARRR
jgi:ArsR family transcriptional regulator, arsenate/arsenite/antimonite-responsive transcriptional repressor